jgi:hypothetical protein
MSCARISDRELRVRHNEVVVKTEASSGKVPCVAFVTR